MPFLSSYDPVFHPCSYRFVATVIWKKIQLLPVIFLFYSSLERNYWISSPSPPLTLADIYCHKKTLKAFSLISAARPSHQQGFFPSAVTSLEMLTQHQASPEKHSPPSSVPRISVWPSFRLTSSSAALSRCRQSSGSVSYPRPAACLCSWMETLQDCSKFTGTRSAAVTQRRARKKSQKKDVGWALKRGLKNIIYIYIFFLRTVSGSHGNCEKKRGIYFSQRLILQGTESWTEPPEVKQGTEKRGLPQLHFSEKRCV